MRGEKSPSTARFRMERATTASVPPSLVVHEATFMTAMSHALRAETGRTELTTPETLQVVVRAHRSVMKAIAARDGAAAARRMQRHVGAYAEKSRQVAATRAAAEASTD